MALKAISVTVLCLLASCAAKQNCSEVQCKLLPIREDVASEFQFIKASEKVRMIYLNLKIGNDSYHPLRNLQNEFLPERWAWASTIGELMLSLSYDYDILSLGLLKRQVSRMDVQLEDEPKGCLAALNSSYQTDCVVARALLGNVTTRDGSGIHLSEDVVCVAKIENNTFFFDNGILQGLDNDVEYRCCNVKQGVLNLIQCDLSVQRSNWLKVFYAVLNVLAVFVGIYSPALLVVLPDFIFNLRNECEKEQQQAEAEERQRQQQETERKLRQSGYELIPSSEMQETVQEENILNANDIEWIMLSVQQPATIADNKIAIEPNSNKPSVDEPNVNGPTHDINDTTKDEDEEKRRADEIPLDDGSPFNIFTVLHKCKSTKIFKDYSTKFTFNIKLAIIWYCVIPFIFYIRFALNQTLKDEYFDEIARKNASILLGGFFLIFDMIDFDSRVILIISYGVIPFLIIANLRPRHLVIEVNEGYGLSLELPCYIGEEVIIQTLKNGREKVVSFSTLFQKPIILYMGIQNICNRHRLIEPGEPGACCKRLKRFVWVSFALILNVIATVISVIATVLCLLIFLVYTTGVICCYSPYFTLLYFCLFKSHSSIERRSFTGCVLIVFMIYIVGLILGLIFLPSKLYNPFFYMLSVISYPFFFALYSCQFVVKMFGYTITGLILNAGISAPIVTFVALVTTNLRQCYLNSQNKYKAIKEIIFQEWQNNKESIAELDKEKELKVTNNTIPTELFWFVCEESKVFPVINEISLMLGNMAIIFLFAFLALSAIFFGNSSYQISTVASTIAVFVSCKIPMLLLIDLFHPFVILLCSC